MAVNKRVIDINAVIQVAKLGRSRRDAQADTCAVFAAALYDVLSGNGIPCRVFSVVKSGGNSWAHAVVKIGGRYYDSLGEFSTSIYRNRAKIHPTVSTNITYKPYLRRDCYEPEFDKLHAFYVKMLNKAICDQVMQTIDHEKIAQIAALLGKFAIHQ